VRPRTRALQASALDGRGCSEPEAHARTLWLAIAEEEGVYVSEWEDGTNLAPAHLATLRGRRIA
jgi:hypothetical protein